MENILPVIFLVLYLVLSGWAKRQRAQRRASAEPLPQPDEKSPKPDISTNLGKILKALKKEVFEVDKPEEEILFQTEDEEIIPPPVETKLPPEPVVLPEVEGTSVFGRGISDREDRKIKTIITGEPESDKSSFSLKDILSRYNPLEQGIILHAIIGPPRAYQKKEDWFHQ